MNIKHFQSPQLLRRLAGSLVLYGLLSGYALAASLTVEGNVTDPISRAYTLAELEALPSVIDKTIDGSTYRGISLWTLLGGTNGIVPVGTSNNAILRSFVTATSTSGAQSLVSVGEIHPFFGGVGDPVLVAFSRNNIALTAPLLIDAEDPSHTRSLADLSSIVVTSAPQPTGGTGGASTTFNLGGVASTENFDLSRLQSFQATTLNGISFQSGSTTTGPFDYTGVKLWDFLVAQGIDTAAKARGYVTVTATDNVAEVFTFAELDPATRGPDDVLIAYDRSNGGLGSAGFARIVVPGDVRGGRYLSNVASLQVSYIAAAVPEPETWALLLSGLGLVAGLARRRARQDVLIH